MFLEKILKNNLLFFAKFLGLLAYGMWLSLARALRSGRRDRAFESPHPDHFFLSLFRCLHKIIFLQFLAIRLQIFLQTVVAYLFNFLAFRRTRYDRTIHSR